MALQTQHRVSASTTPVSYFHSQHAQQPSTPSYFSVSSSSPTMQFKRSQSVQQFRGQGYSMAKKQKESEVQVQSSERMTSLHSRLQQEAEKIRKWKNAIELDTKHKEICLEEANCTVEKQQKAITELQLKNEALQAQLEEEIANQKEIKTKINTTREMCTALKNHCVKIDASLAQGQEDRDHLIRVNQERMMEHQSLLNKYEELEQEQVKWHQSYTDALSAERKEKDGATARCAQLSEDLDASIGKVKVLEDQAREDKTSIAALEEKLVCSQNDAKRLQQEHDCLQATLHNKDEQIEKLKESVEIHKQELGLSKEESERLALELNEVNNTLIKDRNTHHEEVTRLEQSSEMAISEWSTKYEGLKSKLSNMTDNFDEVVASRESVLAQLAESERTCKSMEEELKVSREGCAALEETKKEALVEVDQLKLQLARMQEELHIQIADKERGLEKAEQLISDVVSRHDSARSCWQEKEKEMEARLAGLDKEKKEMEARLAGLDKEKKEMEARLAGLDKEKKEVTGRVVSLSEELEDTKLQLEESVSLTKHLESQYEARVKLLTSEVEELRNNSIILHHQIEVLSKNEENLTLQCSDKAELLRGNSRLTSLLEERTTHFKEIETKLMQEKETALKENERLMLEVQALADQVSTSKSNEAIVEQQHTSGLQKVREDLGGKIFGLNAEIGKLKKEAETAKKDFIRGKKDCDKEVQDLVAAMDSYRSEHEKTIAGKDKVIENFKLQMQQNAKHKESSERELNIYESRLKQLWSDLETKNSEIKELVNSVEVLTQKVEDSSKEIDKKNSEIKDLTSSIETRSQKVEDSGSSEVVSTTPSKRKARGTPRIQQVPKSSQRPSTEVGEVQTSVEPCTSGSGAAMKGLLPSSNTPLYSSHVFKTPALPTPGRLYSYHVKATPLQKNKTIHITPRSSYSGRGKRMRCQFDSECVTNERGKDNMGPGAEDEEVVLKKQKPWNAGVTVQRASSTTTTSKAGKRGATKKATKDLSWFDLDSVYGFGTNDS